MSKSKTMPSLDLKVYIKLVAAVFCISSITAFIFVLLRLITPPMFFLEPLHGNSKVINYFMAAFMIISSGIGFLNSAIMIKRDTAQTTNQDITKWLLLDSVFETTRIIYIFVGEVLLKVNGPLQIYELLISTAQYLLDSFLYCQMILRH